LSPDSDLAKVRITLQVADPDRDTQPIDLARANLNGATLTGADLTDARWPEGELVPEGWRLDAGSGRLEQAGTG
jgi:uncharacterized protein YjbI with pentapeptide repeats